MENDNNDKDAVILQANEADEVFHNENRLARDGRVYTLPIYEIGENFEQIESYINQEASNTNTIDSKRQYTLGNTRALPKQAMTYKLEEFEKHALVIFNQKHVYGQEIRLATEEDVNSLTRTFKNFGFEVETHNDLKKAALFDELQQFSERDFTDYGCVAVAILTHGSKHGMLWAKDHLYLEIDVIKYFKDKPSLVTKPKLFIIQACRGTKTDLGVEVRQSSNIRKDSAKELEPYYSLPLESDLLIIHSSYPGYASHRDKVCGSWFIQTLCKKIDTASSDQDLESILTKVKKYVAIVMEYKEVNKSGETNFNKQMPVTTSTLIRKLYLKKFGERALEETYVDKSRRRSEARREVVDAFSDSPMTPLLVQFGPCSCFLEHFTNIRNCLKSFVAENPNDETAQDLLDVANTYEDSVEFIKSKERMCKVMSKYLMDKVQDSQIYKYLHFASVERKVTYSKNAQNELSMPLKLSYSSLENRRRRQSYWHYCSCLRYCFTKPE